MSAPVVFSGDVDRLLATVLGGDPALAVYVPAGVTASAPVEGGPRPVIRWWRAGGPPAVHVQDGRMGRAESRPRYVVCILDRQRGGQVDREYGSLGASMDPPQPYLELAYRRLAALLGSLQLTLNGFNWYVYTMDEYSDIEDLGQGDQDVSVGVIVQFSIQ